LVENFVNLLPADHVRSVIIIQCVL